MAHKKVKKRMGMEKYVIILVVVSKLLEIILIYCSCAEKPFAQHTKIKSNQHNTIN